PGQDLPGLSGWQMIETPGHTPGHVCFYRPSDRFLLAGDAVTTMDLDSVWGTLTKRKEVCRPPTPATMDWKNARRSVETIAALGPSWIAAGHGAPMSDAAAALARLAKNFPIPGS